MNTQNYEFQALQLMCVAHEYVVNTLLSMFIFGSCIL